MNSINWQTRERLALQYPLRLRSSHRSIQGYSAPEIGEKLFISPKTVDTYKQRIQEKLGLMHRSDYVQLALKLGLLAET